MRQIALFTIILIVTSSIVKAQSDDVCKLKLSGELLTDERL
jgi:hypothetical protein